MRNAATNPRCLNLGASYPEGLAPKGKAIVLGFDD